MSIPEQSPLSLRLVFPLVLSRQVCGVHHVFAANLASVRLSDHLIDVKRFLSSEILFATEVRRLSFEFATEHLR